MLAYTGDYLQEARHVFLYVLYICEVCYYSRVHTTYHSTVLTVHLISQRIIDVNSQDLPVCLSYTH